MNARVKRILPLWTLLGAIAFVIVAFAVIAAAQTTSTSTPTTSATATSPSVKKIVKIKVGDNFFKPQEIEITAGTTVKWTNKGLVLHNITPDQGKLFGVKSLKKGKSYKFTFKTAGTYPYYCTFHGSPGSGQHGTIVVRPAA